MSLSLSLSLSLLLGILLLAKFCTNGVSLGDTTVLSSCTRILLEYFFPPIIESLRHIKYFCPTMKSFRFFHFLAVLQFGALAGRRVLRCRAKFAEYVRYSTVQYSTGTTNSVQYDSKGPFRFFCCTVGFCNQFLCCSSNLPRGFATIQHFIIPCLLQVGGTGKIKRRRNTFIKMSKSSSTFVVWYFAVIVFSNVVVVDA